MIENRPDILRDFITPFVGEKMRDGPPLLVHSFKYYGTETTKIVPSYGMAESGYDIRNGEEITLNPGGTVLTVSLETISIPDHLSARLICKSTLARLGIHLNVTEIDPGFYGRPTLEVGLFPVDWVSQIILPAGCGIGCLQFHEVRERRSYVGKYQGDMAARGAR